MRMVLQRIEVGDAGAEEQFVVLPDRARHRLQQDRQQDGRCKRDLKGKRLSDAHSYNVAVATRFGTAWTVLRRASSGFPIRSRLHLLGRFLSCPFLPIVDALPAGGTILDIGAGHGVLARLAVERVRKVVAVEPDIRKLASALRHPAVAWVCGLDSCIGGGFDAVVLCDVLYRIPGEERDRLLARARARLKPGGILVIKDVDPRRRIKFSWNVVQETIAIRGLRLTLGAGQTYENRAAMTDRLERLGFAGVTARAIDRGYPHPHILYTARAFRPGDDIRGHADGR